jgi:hypothetical protein
MQVITKPIIRKWFEEGNNENNTHMFVVCDTFDWEDYPVYVTKDQNVHKQYEQYHGSNMQKVMEVYSYSIPIDQQLATTHRCFNF